MSRDPASEPDFLVKANAFRVLGLDPKAQGPSILERSNEIQAYLGIERVPTYPSDFPTFARPERSIETIVDAVQRLENPRTRLVDEAAWFHLRDPVDAAAAGALSEGNLRQARAFWDMATSTAQDVGEGLRYQHNLAVLDLAAAECPAEPSEDERSAWHRALTSWRAVLSADGFWSTLAESSPASGDPRFSEELVAEVRRAVGHGVTRGVRRGIKAALARGDEDNAGRWIDLALESGLPQALIIPGLEQVLEPIAAQIQQERERVRSALAEGYAEAPDVVQMESRLGATRQRFIRLLAPMPGSSVLREGAADALAEAWEFLGGYLCTHGSSQRGVELLEAAAQVASSEAARVRIARHAQVGRWNAAYSDFTAALGRRDFSAASATLATLEAAHDGTDPPEIRETLDQCRQAVRRLRVFRDCEPIEAAPALWTINGCGTHIYGQAEPDTETGTYVGTLFFTLLFVPILVLSRFRMRDAEGGGHQFFGRVPLGRFGWTWNAVVAALLLAVVVGSNLNTAPPPRSVASTAPETGPAQSPSPLVPRSPGESLSSLRKQIDQRRPEIEADQAALRTESQAIDRENDDIRQLRTRIERRRALNPDGLPADELAVDRREVADHNQRLEAVRRRIDAYDRRVDEVKAAIAEFNAMVARYNGGGGEKLR